MPSPDKREERINENEKKVLTHLLTIYDNDGSCTYFRFIAAGTKLEIKQVRRACRSLAKKGLAEYVRGLFDDEGFTAGSGYCATEKGRELGDKLKL